MEENLGHRSQTLVGIGDPGKDECWHPKGCELYISKELFAMNALLQPLSGFQWLISTASWVTTIPLPAASLISDCCNMSMVQTCFVGGSFLAMFVLSLVSFSFFLWIQRQSEDSHATILREWESVRKVEAQVQHLLEVQQELQKERDAFKSTWQNANVKITGQMERLWHKMEMLSRAAGRVGLLESGLSELQNWLVVNHTRHRFAQTYEQLRLRLFADVRRLQQGTDCSNAKYLACSMLNKPCNFGCQVHTIADCMTSALLTNRTAVLLPSQLYRYGPECSSQWHCFFLPLASCQRHAATVNDTLWHPWTSGGTHPYAVYNAWGEDENRVPPYLSVLDDTMFDAADPKPSAACLLTGVLMSWLLRPNERVAAAIAHRRHSLGLEGAPFHVGVHVRRSDKRYEATIFGLQHYMMQVDQFVGPGDYYHASYGRRYGKRLLIVSGVLWGVPPSKRARKRPSPSNHRSPPSPESHYPPLSLPVLSVV